MITCRAGDEGTKPDKILSQRFADIEKRMGRALMEKISCSVEKRDEALNKIFVTHTGLSLQNYIFARFVVKDYFNKTNFAEFFSIFTQIYQSVFMLDQKQIAANGIYLSQLEVELDERTGAPLIHLTDLQPLEMPAPAASPNQVVLNQKPEKSVAALKNSLFYLAVVSLEVLIMSHQLLQYANQQQLKLTEV